MDGILLVNKEKNMTSRDVVNIISKKFNTRKVGHTGTLDPIATGVLGVAIGKGLKIVDFLINDTKEYIATAKMGISTDTLDITGKITFEKKKYRITKEKLIDVLNTFKGKSTQEVPMFSALKVNGKRLYEYARSNDIVEIPKREINISSIELLTFEDDCFTFKVTVSKGTYIRSLIRDIGIKLDVPCVMSDLVRIKQGIFDIKDCYTINDIKNNNYKILSIASCLSNYHFVEVNSFIENKIKNGRILENRYKDNIIVFINDKQEVIAIYKVYEKDTTKIKPIRVFHNS